MLGPSRPTDPAATQAMADLVDWMLRILISYAVGAGRAPASNRDDIRRQLTTLFLPAFERLLAVLAG